MNDAHDNAAIDAAIGAAYRADREVNPGKYEKSDWEKVVSGTADASPRPECEHTDISWHGLRGECQDCGENVSPTFATATATLDMYASIRALATQYGFAYAQRMNNASRPGDEWSRANMECDMVSNVLAQKIGQFGQYGLPIALAAMMDSAAEAHELLRSRP